jgi:hypothetical protein
MQGIRTSSARQFDRHRIADADHAAMQASQNVAVRTQRARSIIIPA